MMNNMVPILNRSILISKVCDSDNMKTWSNIHVHIILWNLKCLHTPCRSILLCPYPYLYPYGYYKMWSITTLHEDQHSILISLFVTIRILQSVEHPHTPCSLTVYVEYTVNP